MKSRFACHVLVPGLQPGNALPWRLPPHGLIRGGWSLRPVRSEAGASERVTSNVSRTTCRRLATEHVLPQHILGLASEAIDCHCSAIQVSLIGFAPVFQRTSTHRQCAKTNHAGTRGSCCFATQPFQAAPPNWTDFRFLISPAAMLDRFVTIVSSLRKKAAPGWPSRCSSGL